MLQQFFETEQERRIEPDELNYIYTQASYELGNLSLDTGELTNAITRLEESAIIYLLLSKKSERMRATAPQTERTTIEADFQQNSRASVRANCYLVRACVKQVEGNAQVDSAALEQAGKALDQARQTLDSVYIPLDIGDKQLRDELNAVADQLDQYRTALPSHNK